MSRAAWATAAALSAALFATPHATAFVWQEGEAYPAAGSTLATAQVVPTDRLEALEGIRGTLRNTVPLNGTPRFEVDLYQIVISDFASFSATSVSLDVEDDTALFLFDATGLAVYSNDDTGAGLLAALAGPGLQANGVYFLGIALGGFEAFDASGRALFADGLPAAGAGVLAAWATPFTRLQELPLSYGVLLTGAGVSPVPEPQALALLTVGLGVLAWRRRACASPSAPQ
jgi:hypothetical protein